MSEAAILTVVGLILSIAAAFLGGVWAYVNSRDERERKLVQHSETEQFRRIEELEETIREMRRCLRKQSIRTSRHDEPSPPERAVGGSA